MTYRISLSDDGTYVEMTLEGKVTRSEALRCDIEAHRLAKRNGISKFLVDIVNCRNAESVLNNHELVYKDLPAEPEIDKGAVFAVVMSSDDRSHDFMIMSAQNNGFRVERFFDPESARAFLKRGRSARPPSL